MSPAMLGEKELYPAEIHFGVVAETPFAHQHALLGALAGCDVTAPLEPGPPSRSGRYATFRVSVRCASRDEHENLSAALAKAPGVKMVL